eukprot:TRINITY_DN6629_c0_g1_i2.p1 TRINITY_DN6629_c0_g1~~TRINITY_DN6629_c0_g1_i2.p1  ORF type:complete len:312 (-),score=76.21 TRINITY_DN6629_c0_g1_i2:222-1157(-)
MQTSIDGELDKMKQEIAIFENNCHNDLALLKEELKTVIGDKLEATEVMYSEQPKASMYNREVESLQKQLREFETQIEKLTKVRTEEAADFEQKKHQTEEALDIVIEAKKRLESLHKSTTFLLQTSHHKKLVHIKNQLKREKPSSPYLKHLKPLLTQIASGLTRNPSSELVEQSIEMMHKLVDAINSDAVNSRNAEDARVKIYDDQMASIATKKEEAENMLKNYEAEIARITGRLDAASRKLHEAEKSIVQKARQVVTKRKECRDQTRSYRKLQVKKHNQKIIADGAAQIVADNYDDLKGFLLGKMSKSATE